MFFDIVPAHEIVPTIPPETAGLRLYARAHAAAAPAVRLMAVGDIALSGRVRARGQQAGFETLLAALAPTLHTADLVFANLEAPFTHTPVQPLYFADPASADAVREAGIDLVHLANNHILDQGAAGLATTLERTRAVGLQPLGAAATQAEAQAAVITTVHTAAVHTTTAHTAAVYTAAVHTTTAHTTTAHTAAVHTAAAPADAPALTIGWLACGRTHLPQAATGPQFWEYDPDALEAAVKALRPQADIVAVSIHTGYMLVDYPHPDHRAAAHRLAAAGADVILIHHAHVLQGVETVSAPGGRTCVILYNMGNLLLDTTEGNVITGHRREEQREAGVFVFDLDADGVRAACFVPTQITPEWTAGWDMRGAASPVLERLARISHDLVHADAAALFQAQNARLNTAQIFQVMAFHVRRGNWRFVFESAAKVRPRHLGMIFRWLRGRVLARSTPAGS
jgi:poly-gamma-glutamate synthesis protein (capsule biosynthesis protein)